MSELYAIYLHPDSARRGIGTLLISHAENEMRERGASETVLWVLRDNARARRFHEANGWHLDPRSDKEDQRFGQTIVEVRYRTDLVTTPVRKT